MARRSTYGLEPAKEGRGWRPVRARPRIPTLSSWATPRASWRWPPEGLAPRRRSDRGLSGPRGSARRTGKPCSRGAGVWSDRPQRRIRPGQDSPNLSVYRMVFEPRAQPRLTLNHPLPQGARPCPDAPGAVRLGGTELLHRRGWSHGHNQGRDIWASGARVRRVRRDHRPPGARKGLVRVGRRWPPEELRVQRVRHTPYASRPRGRSRRSTLSLTVASVMASPPRNTVMFRPSKNTMRFRPPEVGF